MIKACDSVIQEHAVKIQALEKEILEIEKKLSNECNSYSQDLADAIRQMLKTSRFFKTNDGYIAVDDIKEVQVLGLFKHMPKVVLSGLYLRGIDSNEKANNWWTTGKMYGYYDSCAGFLLNELVPVSKEVFSEKVQSVLLHIKANLHYNPDYRYRQEGDDFDMFLKDAKRAKIDIEYYPELKITIE